MKGFNNSTKMQMGHTFPQTSVQIAPHTRAMPAKRSMPPSTVSDTPITDSPLAVTAPSMPSPAKGLSPQGYAPRMARLTLKASGKTGVRPPRTSQVEPTDGNEDGFAKGGSVRDPRSPMISPKSGC